MDYLHVIQNCLEILLTNIEPVIHSTMSQIYGNDYILYINYGPKASNFTLSEMRDFGIDINNSQNIRKYKDILFYLNSIIKNWEILKGLFRSNYVLCLCHSIKYFRNKWAHQSKFTKRELHRFIDECAVLLEEFNLKSEQIDLLRKKALDAYYQEEVMIYSQLVEENVNYQRKQDYQQSNDQIRTNLVDENVNYQRKQDYQQSNEQIKTNLVKATASSSSVNLINNNKLKEKNSTQKYIGYYNDFSNINSHSNCNDHVMAEGYEGTTESLFDENYYRVINDKEKNYKDYKIYFYDQEKEDAGNRYKN